MDPEATLSLLSLTGFSVAHNATTLIMQMRNSVGEHWEAHGMHGKFEKPG